MSRSISIYVVTHKEFNPPTGEIYVPIQVGKMFTKNELPYIGDDTGDNITQKNKNYCELTAMYWIWKNDDSKIVGLCHYRRYFTVSAVFANRMFFLTKSRIKKYLDSVDIIVPYKQTHNMNVADYYDHCDGRKSDLLKTRTVIEELYPEYLKDYDAFLRQNDAFYCNMLIARKDTFDEYCEWLFSILQKVEDISDLSGYTQTEARIYGYISELLLNVWVIHNNISVKYCHVVNTDESIRARIKRLLKGI